MAVFTGFWQETGSKVAEYQKRRLQGWFARHPATFVAAWGAKGLLWNLPRFTYRASRDGWLRWRGQVEAIVTAPPRVKTPPVSVPAWGPAPAPNVRRVVATPVPGGPGFVIDLTTGPVFAAPAAISIISIDRRRTMEEGKKLLRGTLFGRGFLSLSDQLRAFIPIRAHEAVSVLKLLDDVHKGMLRIHGAIDAFSDIVAACGLHDKVTHPLYLAAETAEALAGKFARAKNLVETIYEGQLQQDASVATTVQTLPVRVVSADLAPGIGPACTAIAVGFSGFLPDPKTEATSILDQIRLAQAGWAVLAGALEELTSRLVTVSKRVRVFVSAAKDEALILAAAFRAARTEMLKLYNGQMVQEASGTPTIRTIPTAPAA